LDKSKINITFILKLLLITNIIFFSSCQATRYLKDDEKFLHKNRIILDSDSKIDNKILLKEELNTLIQQRPSESILYVPRYWFYYVTLNKDNALANFAKKRLAQNPPIFDEKYAKETTKKLKNFLKTKKGFINVNVEYKVFPEKHIVDVDYIIHTGKRYTINSVKYNCDDSIICKLIENTKYKSYLKPPDGLDYLNYDLEKIRITNLLQNNGYATFNQNFIELTGDSSNYKVDLTIKIKNPGEGQKHRIFKTGIIEVFTDYYPQQPLSKLNSDTLDNIIFHHQLDDYLVDLGLLKSAINLKSGEIYRKDKTRDIYNKLSKFNIYRFISIKTSIDDKNDSLLTYKIYMYVHENKYFSDGNIALKYVTLLKEEQFIEFGGSGLFQDRKLSSRGDYIRLSGSGDVKINLKDKKYSEYVLLGKLNYTNPISPVTIKYSPLYLYYGLSQKQSLQSLKNNTTTDFSLSYNNQTILGKYIISSLNANYGYSYIPNKKLNILVNQTGINYLAPKIFSDTLFNRFQTESMNNVFLTGLLMKNININYYSNKQNSLYNYRLLFGFETSGLEIFFTNKINNLITKDDGYWKFNNSISYAKFIKTHIEYRPIYKLSSNSELAGRLYGGIGIPFADNDVIPYIKQFEAGGPYSMRAWATRELGPGSYIDTNASKKQIPYQKGDIRFEANLEYRFKLSYLFKSAIFIDAGNIWTLKNDIERPGSQFTSSFYKQIAIDAGVSLQLDVFVLLRFDFAYKLRNPYPDANGSYFGLKNSFIPNIVFALNHPF